MKKLVVLIILIISLICCSQNYIFAKTKKQITKHKIEFTTKDGFILVGDLYLSTAKSTKPLIIMLHSYTLNASAWQPIAESLRLKGYNVLAMDMRGHGRSVYNENMVLRSRYKLQNSAWAKLPNDVLESVAYIKQNYSKVNTNQTIIIGADLGASAGILAGEKMRPQPIKFILISPLDNFKGLYLPLKLANITSSKYLILYSQQDKTSKTNAEKLSRFMQSKPVIKTYPKGGCGNMLLKTNKSAQDDLINFIIN